MRITEKVLNKVLHRLLSAFVLSFAQNFFRLAPTKNATIFNSDFDVLDSFSRLSFSPRIIYFLNLHPLFFVVKSLEANLVINSDARIVL